VSKLTVRYLALRGAAKTHELDSSASLRVAPPPATSQSASNTAQAAARDGLSDGEVRGFRVAWWEGAVQRPGGDQKSEGRDHSRGSGGMILSMPQAEKHTGISNQQVSRWRRRLQEPEAYRAMLYGVAWLKAMAKASNTTATKWTGDPESYTTGLARSR
jgi:hypothetical protein